MTPTSASKAMAEIAIKSFIKSFFTNRKKFESWNWTCWEILLVVEIGSSDRIIPDCVKAWSRGEEVNIRSPKAPTGLDTFLNH